MKNLRITLKEISPLKHSKAEKKPKIFMKESHSVNLSKEEVELIKKGLHLEEMSICEILNDDMIKYQHQLSVIKDLYNKLDAV
jgi:hypothetical protein